MDIDDFKAETQEGVALRLLKLVAVAENKLLAVSGGADRAWILGAYADCLRAVKPVKTMSVKSLSL